MLKLFKRVEDQLLYWETWEVDAVTHVVHWGTVGENGDSRTLDFDSTEKAHDVVHGFVTDQQSDGYAPIDLDDHAVLRIDYDLRTWGAGGDVDMRHELEARLNETLGWKGIGHVDGGSIGSNSMEVFCFVVDAVIAKAVIEQDLADTKYAGYAAISGRPPASCNG